MAGSPRLGLDAVAWLRTAKAVRKCSHEILALARAGQLNHFSLDESCIAPTVAFVADVIRQNYPSLDIPYHSRWRHFAVGNHDRWKRLQSTLAVDAAELARIRFDLVITSVLLDAGAGPDWRYRDSVTGEVLSRSEGLAIASLDAFANGAFSSHENQPLRADGQALVTLDESTLAARFQVSSANPLAGLAGRLALMQGLGRTLKTQSRYFGEQQPRIGHLYDFLVAKAVNRSLAAPEILTTVLNAFEGIWPGRLHLAGCNLGDVWRHGGIGRDTEDDASGLIPFHKLSQWLTYSLVEPLEDAGFVVTQLDELTGLAEYRNGGLFLDMGVIVPQGKESLASHYDQDSQYVIEWRALTVALLDEMLDDVRRALSLNAQCFPLAKLLEGGTWSAGRTLAFDRRPNGEPPIHIVTDGSLF